MAASVSEESAPICLPSLVLSSVVTWWHRATLGLAMPPAPADSATAVGPRRACAPDLDSGTTMIERHPDDRLKPSFDTTMTGRQPRCSDPDRGLRSAHKTWPRLTAFASVSSGDATAPEMLPRGRDRNHPDCRRPLTHRRRSPRGGPLCAAPATTTRSHVWRRPWPADLLVARHREGAGTSVREAGGESSGLAVPCHECCHDSVATVNSYPSRASSPSPLPSISRTSTPIASSRRGFSGTPRARRGTSVTSSGYERQIREFEERHRRDMDWMALLSR